ncbi:MAG: hypothetical protein V4735_02410 [Pseudomonadota bacterium]
MQRAHGLEDARAALAAGASALVSSPFAACHAGVNYYRALVAALRAEFPQAFTFTLCCGDDPAIAHDALRLGFSSIICETSESMLAQLRAAAATVDAQVLARYPNA